MNRDGLIREPFTKRLAAMKAEASVWYATWKEMQAWIYPSRGFFSDVPNEGQKIDHTTILDGHPQRCVRDMASGMMSGMTSPSRPWFKWGVDDDPDLEEWGPVKVWLDDVARIQLSFYGRSNIYDCFYSIYEEVGVFGTGAMMLVSDYLEGLRGHTYTAGEYFLSMGEDARINGFGRQYWRTVQNLIAEFGKENVSPQVKADYDNHVIDRWYKVNHLVEINDTRIPGFIDAKNMEYRSVYWESNAVDDSFLKIGGFNEFPVFSPRWQKRTTADIYGRGPGGYALGHIKQLQEETKQKLIGLDRVVDPPLQADASIIGEINTLPGGVTRSSSNTPNAGVRPAYQINPDIPAIRADIEALKLDISRDFYADLFKMFIGIDRGNITATEIAERQAEKLAMLSPAVEKFNNELLNPCNTRGFNLLLAAGAFPKPPKEIQGKEIRPRYISSLAMAQRMVGVQAISQGITFVGATMAIAPEIKDTVNFDMASIEYLTAIGVPAKVINSPDKIAALRKQRAEAQAAAQTAQDSMMMVEAAAKGTKSIKDLATSPMGRGSALDGITKTLEGAE